MTARESSGEPKKSPGLAAFTLDKRTKFYRNCCRRRRENAQICGDCPFRAWIEASE